MSALKNMMGAHRPGVVCVSSTEVSGVWLWRCHCGNEFERKGSAVTLACKRNGKTSCGCDLAAARSANGKSNKTHGRSVGVDRKLYDVWRQMHRRCELPYHKDFQAYGGRGISVCDDWSDVEKFCDWANSNGYGSGLTIERLDVNGNYHPGNCTWVTVRKQGANMRKNVHLKFNGNELHISEWSRLTGIHIQTILQRIRIGWPDSEILTIAPVKGRNGYWAV